jgi:hypothetical protein
LVPKNKKTQTQYAAMKKIATFTLSLCLSAGALSAQDRGGEKAFTIRGEIAGLEAGDTLRFARIEFPNLTLAPDFEVVVAAPDRFEYTGRQPHVQQYIMSYRPRTGQAPESDRTGQTMIVDGGTVTITGNREDIYYSRIDGEAFGEQPLLRQAEALGRAIGRERSRYLRLGRAALAAGDSVGGREYIRQFSEFRREDESRRIAGLQREFLYRNPSSPWSLVERLGRAKNTPIDTLEAYYATLDAPARAGHLGTTLRKTIDDLVRLLPGQPAPDFAVTLPDGTVMNSSAFRGKYLLIYHWGFCPGSIQREMDITELYNRFRDHFELLGITESLEAIRQAALTTPPDATLYGMTLKPIYESMAVHPWIEAEDGTGENHRISELYAFAGFPYFVLVSPDGKFVSRGFHDTFFETKQILETQYDQK